MLIPIHDSTNYYIHIDSGPIQGTEATVASIVARNAGQDLTNDSTSIQLHFQHPKPPNITASAMFKNDAVVKSSSATVSTTLPVKINQGIVFYQVKRDKIFDPTKIDFASLSLPSLVKHSENKSK